MTDVLSRAFDVLKKFNASEARDEHGRWTDGGASAGGKEVKAKKPKNAKAPEAKKPAEKKPKKPLAPIGRATVTPKELPNNQSLATSLKDMFTRAKDPTEKRALHSALTYALAARWREAKTAGKESEQIDLRDQLRKLPIYHGVTIRSYLEPALVLKDMAAKERSSKRKAILQTGAAVLIRQQEYVSNYYHMNVSKLQKGFIHPAVGIDPFFSSEWMYD